MALPVDVSDAPRSQVKIDVWSDIACPWCYLGKRRLEKALAEFDGDATIEYHSFELAPDTPVDFAGSEIDFLSRHKRIPREQAEAMLAKMTSLAAEEGLSYDYDALQHTKTLKAHELLHHAKAVGRQGEMKERLLKAYFEQGRHVGHIEELVALAEDVGIDGTAAREALESGRHAADVAADIAQARELDINGVPFYVFEQRVAVSGAQPPGVFADVLARLAKGDL